MLRFGIFFTLGLLGCAPLATLRPASGLMPDKDAELGMGLVALGPRPYVDETTQFMGQFWGTIEPKDWLRVSAIGAYSPGSGAIGGAVGWNAFRNERFATTLEAELGYAWAASSLDLAVRTWGDAWLYTAPRFGTMGFNWSFGAPVGLSVRIWEGLLLRAETQLSWAGLKYYNRRQHFALAAAYQF